MWSGLFKGCGMGSRDLATSPVGLKLPAVARAERSGAEASLNLDLLLQDLRRKVIGLVEHK